MYNKEQVLEFAIFMHMQKTAGTTIVDLARKHYGEHNIISHGDYFQAVYHFPLKGDFKVDKQVLNNFHTIPFLSGHFGYDFTKKFMANRYSLTFLRDPVEKVLSFYYFCRKQDPNVFEMYKLCQQTELNEFLEMGFHDPEVQYCIWNNQVWQLACGYGNLDNLQPSSFRSNELLEMAVEHLKDFSHIGFTETFEKDRDIILKKLGIKPPKAKIVSNTNPGRPKFNDLPKSSQNLLMELTKLDRALYAQAWSEKASPIKRYVQKWL